MGDNERLTNENGGSDNECYDTLTTLVDGINLNELSQGTTFQIKAEDNGTFFKDDAQSYFGSDEILKHIRLDCLDDDLADEDGVCVPGDTPFDNFAAKMKDIVEDGGVKKKVVQHGEKNSPKVPEGALVTIQYNAYNEFIEEPFDSTYMRTGPQKFRLGNGSLLPGVELAVRSMCRKERSWFLIKPHLAFGKLGCPPRILPDATVLFDIHLIDFIDSGGAANFDALTLEEQSKADFRVVLKAAKGFHLQGNELFKSKMYSQATKRYRRAVQILENCTTIKDQKEEMELNRLLVKLYVNLGVSYNNVNDPPKTCIFTKKALALDPHNSKALYHRGKAFLSLSEFSEAKFYLLAAQRIEPECPEINDELKRLEEKQRSYLCHEQEICQRMFPNVAMNDQSSIKEKKKKSVHVGITDAFQKTVETNLKDFMIDDRDEPLIFPQGLTAVEIDFIKNRSEEYDLKFSTTNSGRLTISKK